MTNLELYNKLCPKNDADLPDALKEQFADIVAKIIELQKKESRGIVYRPLITPNSKKILQPFQVCKLTDYKVVILCMGPHKEPELANGFAYSIPLNEPATPTTQIILQSLILSKPSVAAHIEEGTYFLDLATWIKDGVLLLNVGLTTYVNKNNAHLELWKPFTIELLKHIDTVKEKKMIYVAFGDALLNILLEAGLPKGRIVHVANPNPLANQTEEFLGSRWDIKVRNLVNVIGEAGIDFHNVFFNLPF